MASRIVQVYDTLVLRQPKAILLVLFSLLVFFGYHAKDFKLDASADSLLLEDDLDLQEFREIHERYPSGDLLVVTYTPREDLFSDQALESLRELREKLKQVSGVATVFTILDAPLLNISDLPFEEMIKDIPSLEKAGIDRAAQPAPMIFQFGRDIRRRVGPHLFKMPPGAEGQVLVVEKVLLDEGLVAFLVSVNPDSHRDANGQQPGSPYR